MKGVLQLVGVVVALSIVLAISTTYDNLGDSTTRVLGLPVISARQQGAHGWLAMGQTASGVLVIAQGGVGLVAFVQGGAGLFFGLGQGILSLATMAQVGVGVFGFVGQAGIGAQAIGQGVWRARSTAYFYEVSEELNELLRFRLRGR